MLSREGTRGGSVPGERDRLGGARSRDRRGESNAEGHDRGTEAHRGMVQSTPEQGGLAIAADGSARRRSSALLTEGVVGNAEARRLVRYDGGYFAQ